MESINIILFNAVNTTCCTGYPNEGSTLYIPKLPSALKKVTDLNNFLRWPYVSQFILRYIP